MTTPASQPKASDTQVGGDHYSRLKVQPAWFCTQNKLGFLEGSVIKRVCRHTFKDGRQDLEKAIHELRLLIEWKYPEEQPTVRESLMVEPPQEEPGLCDPRELKAGELYLWRNNSNDHWRGPIERSPHGLLTSEFEYRRCAPPAEQV